MWRENCLHCIVYDARKREGSCWVSPTAEGDAGAGRLIHSYIPARSPAGECVCGLLLSWVGERDSKRREVVGLHGPSTHMISKPEVLKSIRQRHVTPWDGGRPNPSFPTKSKTSVFCWTRSVPALSFPPFYFFLCQDFIFIYVRLIFIKKKF